MPFASWRRSFSDGDNLTRIVEAQCFDGHQTERGYSMAGIARELVQTIRECFPLGEYEITMASNYEHNMLSAAIDVPHATLSDVDLARLAELIDRLDGELDPAFIKAIRGGVPGEREVYRMFMGAICHVRLRPNPGHKRIAE